MQGQQVHGEDARRTVETHAQFCLRMGDPGHDGVPAAHWPGIRGGIVTLAPLRRDDGSDQGDGSGGAERCMDLRNYSGGHIYCPWW